MRVLLTMEAGEGRMFDWLTGTRRPRPGVAPAPPDEVHRALLAVNRPTAPFVIRPCTPDDRERADLVAEWRLTEPLWYAVFGAVEAKQLRVFMRFVPERCEVRNIDRSLDVVWSIDGPMLVTKWSRGQVKEIRFGIPPFVETTAQGQRFAFRFSTGDLKNPLREAVTGAGWTWRGASLSL